MLKKNSSRVVVARRGGCSASFDTLNKYFGISQMPVAGSTYWNMVHGRVPGEAVLDEEGMQTMRNLAKNLAWMMKCFALGREQEIPLPDNALIAAVASGGDVEVANADTLLFPGDKAIVVADEDVLDEVRQAFRGL